MAKTTISNSTLISPSNVHTGQLSVSTTSGQYYASTSADINTWAVIDLNEPYSITELEDFLKENYSDVYAHWILERDEIKNRQT